MTQRIKPHVNALALTNVDATEAAAYAFGIINKIQHQHERPELQLVGAALAFILLAHRLNAQPEDIYRVAVNILDRSDEAKPALAAVKRYLANEL